MAAVVPQPPRRPTPNIDTLYNQAAYFVKSFLLKLKNYIVTRINSTIQVVVALAVASIINMQTQNIMIPTFKCCIARGLPNQALAACLLAPKWS